VSSEEGTSLSIAQQVSAACMPIQNSLVNLAEAVETCSAFCAEPKSSVAHLSEKEAQTQSGSSSGSVAGLGHTEIGGNDTEDGGGQSSELGSVRAAQPPIDATSCGCDGQSSELGRVRSTQPSVDATSGGASFSSNLEGPQTNLINRSRPVDATSSDTSSPSMLKGNQTNLINRSRYSVEEDSGGSLRHERNKFLNGAEGKIVEEVYKTTERIRKLTVQQRWRSKGGMGSFITGTTHRPG